MANTNLTNLAGALKRNYNDGSDIMTNQQNLYAPFWNKIKTSSLKPSGDGIYNSVVMEGNERGGAIFENQAFFEPDSVKPVQPRIKSKTVQWNFEITGKAIRLSASDKVAFGRAVDEQQKDNMKRMLMDLNRQANGTGTGQISLANGAGVGSTQLIVDDPFPFRVGMRIDVWTAINGVKEVSGVRINNVNYETSTLTLAAAQNWSDNSIIVKELILDGVSPGNFKELNGTQAIADTNVFSTIFEGIDVTQYPIWQGNVVDGGGAPVSQDLLLKTNNRIAVTGGSTPDILKSNYGQARNYQAQELPKTRYEPGEIKGGVVVLKWQNMEWIVDWTYPIGEVAMLSSQNIEKFQTRDMHLADETGNTLYQIPGYDNIGGYYIYEGDIGTWKRNAHGRLTNLLEPLF
ncbi:MAG: hypothetical protein BWY41_00113 [Candidatus Atribacteria bacterium ADurb.Bin276]|uniref:Major capsid protein n=1 Tax=Candidatus Atribacter allofermentans TaxID=1852833 RepID=A0A1V5T4J2_9BACT|nr:MAG: hypothetical protein BWY41_00113 [Candidatus Atribacteria bacterium ADurb.Bin276]